MLGGVHAVLTCEVCEQDGWPGSCIGKLFSPVKSVSRMGGQEAV